MERTKGEPLIIVRWRQRAGSFDSFNEAKCFISLPSLTWDVRERQLMRRPLITTREMRHQAPTFKIATYGCFIVTESSSCWQWTRRELHKKRLYVDLNNNCINMQISDSTDCGFASCFSCCSTLKSLNWDYQPWQWDGNGMNVEMSRFIGDAKWKPFQTRLERGSEKESNSLCYQSVLECLVRCRCVLSWSRLMLALTL